MRAQKTDVGIVGTSMYNISSLFILIQGYAEGQKKLLGTILYYYCPVRLESTDILGLHA